MRYIITILIVMVLFAISYSDTNPLYVKANKSDFDQNPALLERIIDSPHGYFRFINIEFSQYICEHFKDIVEQAPSLNLHGDAHLEQYAVTDLGRGLTDFDDSSTGPGIIDLMRFIVSLRLTCFQLGWEERTEELVDEFILGYINSLDKPELVPQEPDIAKHIRTEFKHDRDAYFDWIDSIMLPMPQTEKDSIIVAMGFYVETSLMDNPDLNRDFYDVIDMGYLKMGIGSALDLKYVVRVNGSTDEPDDDIVLEIKQVRDLTGIDCIQTGQKQDPFRILVGQSRIAYEPFHHLGYFRFRNMNFWVHSWVDNYKELSIDKSYTYPSELKQVIYDVGVQLGKGHVKHIAAPFDLHVRLEQINLVAKNKERILRESKILSQNVIDAWRLFKRSIE